MKKALIPLMLAFGVTLAALVGQRLNTDAMAVVLGVAVGVAASVPTSLLLVALLRRERGGAWRAEPPAAPAAQLPAPNVIMLNPADLLAARREPPYVPLPPPELSAADGGLRRLRIVGNDDEWNANPSEW
jgi:hypothetical protein